MKSILIMIAILFVGCSNKQEVIKYRTIVKIEREKILVPNQLLLQNVTPEVPKELNEESISEYILKLYISATINEKKIDSIRKIIERFNSESFSDLNVSVK